MGVPNIDWYSQQEIERIGIAEKIGILDKDCYS